VRHKPSSASAMLIDEVPVVPVRNVRNLGFYIDGELSLRTHVQRMTSCCFAALRQKFWFCAKNLQKFPAQVSGTSFLSVYQGYY